MAERKNSRTASTRPRAARTRLRAAHARGERDTDAIRRDVEIAFGKPIEEWDWEELSRGRVRGEGVEGRIHGRKPKIMPHLINLEAQRRMRALTEHEILTMGDAATRCMLQLMTNDEVNEFGSPVVPAAVKMQCAKYILDHIVGTPKQRHEVSGEQNKLLELMGGVLVNPDGEPSHVVVEGEIVEDEDEDGGE